MPLYLFYTMVQKSQKWPKTQIKGGSCLNLLVWKSSLSLSLYFSFFFSRYQTATSDKTSPTKTSQTTQLRHVDKKNKNKKKELIVSSKLCSPSRHNAQEAPHCRCSSECHACLQTCKNTTLKLRPSPGLFFFFFTNVKIRENECKPLFTTVRELWPYTMGFFFKLTIFLN